MKDETSLFKTVKFQNIYKHNLHICTFYFTRVLTQFVPQISVLLTLYSLADYHKILQEIFVSILRVGKIALYK